MSFDSIKHAYEQFALKSFDRMYLALDIHGTVADSDYLHVSHSLYSVAIQPLPVISHLPEVCIILYSCCHPEDYASYFKLFQEHNICVKYFNENPEVTNTQTGCFDVKFYYNLIFEDKGVPGFEPSLWPGVCDAFLTYRQFNPRVRQLFPDSFDNLTH